MTIALFLAALLGAMAVGVPIAFALLVTGAALMWHLGMFDTQILAQNVHRRRQQLSAAGGAVLHAGRRDHERRRPVAPHRQPGHGAGGPCERRDWATSRSWPR
jgi:hypothetical protein